MRERSVETRRGIKVHVREAGDGPPLVFLHGAGGLFPANPFLERLAERFQVFAPDWPGYGQSSGEEKLEDMLDFTLHGWDVVEALGIAKPHLVGHSMGGMIAAEMACVAPHDLAKLVLVAPAGLWLDAHPIPDLYSVFPEELPALVAHDPEVATKLMAGGVDFDDMEALKAFLIVNARQMGTAGKILFPIPNRRVSKRLYRLRAETLLVWGREDRLIVPAYAARWQELVPHAALSWIEQAGHLVPYEKEDEFVKAVGGFLDRD